MERSSYCRIVTVRHALSSFTSRFSFSLPPSGRPHWIGDKVHVRHFGGFAFPFNCPCIQHIITRSPCAIPVAASLSIRDFSRFLVWPSHSNPIASFITRVPRSSPQITARHQASTTPIIDRPPPAVLHDRPARSSKLSSQEVKARIALPSY